MLQFTFGFYNSLNGDRKYDAVQISSIFDGVIRDGVYDSIGEKLTVKASEANNQVIVGTGRAWFNHTWNQVDAPMMLTCEQSELVLDRIDAVVLEINDTETDRINSIKIVKGVGGSDPKRPEMVKTDNIHQYPLAYIYRPANIEKIDQENITNTVGTSECPFVTGILDQVSIDDLLLQWQAQWNNFVKNYEQKATDWQEEKEQEFDTFTDNYMTNITNFEKSNEDDFNAWFKELKVTLDGDVAGHLQNEIEAVAAKEFDLHYGMIEGSTKIKADGTIVSIDNYGTATTVFETVDGVDYILTDLIPKQGEFYYRRTTKIENIDGESEITYSYSREAKEYISDADSENITDADLNKIQSGKAIIVKKNS